MRYDKLAWSPRAYFSFDDIHAELDRFEGAERAGKLRTTGSWEAAEILDHCAKIMRCSFDGFEASVPLVLRVLASVVFKPWLGRWHMKPGIKLPKKAASILPSDGVSFDAALASMRAQLARIDAGERMTHDSPALGRMTHEQWFLLHLDHCRMHFGFVQCG